MRQTLQICAVTLFVTIVFCACAQSPRVLPVNHLTGAKVSDTPNQKQWWRSFNDEALNTVVESAIDKNFDIKAAWDRLAEAEADARLAGVDLTPRVDARLGADADRDLGSAKTSSQTYSLGIFATYEVDLWGRLRAAAQAGALEAEAFKADVYAAGVSLSAEIALQWVEFLAAKDILALLKDQEKANTEVYEVLQARFLNGDAQQADVLRQQNLVESNKADIELAMRDMEIRQTLVLLLASNSVSKDLIVAQEGGALPKIPDTFHGVVTTDAIARRPDLLAAYRRVQAADRDLAAALADRYPRIALSASLQTRGEAADLFDNWIVNLVGNIIQPLIDAGEREWTVERERARLSGLINQYSQSVLVAIQETQASMIEEARQRAYYQHVVAQRDRAKLIVERLRDSYVNQVAEYIDVQNALVSLQRLEREVIATHRNILAARIAFYRATAGAPDMARSRLRDDEMQESESPK